MAISREILKGEAILIETVLGEAIGIETLEGEVIAIETLEGRWDQLKTHNTSIPRGDSREYRLEVTDENDNVVDIDGATIRFTVKENISDDDPGIFQLTSANSSQIEIDDGGNGKARIFVTNANTQSMDIKRHVYDVQVQPASGGVKTVVSGTFTITEDITRTV